MESIFKVKKSKNLNPPFPWNSPSTPPSPVPVNYTVELETQDRYRGVQVNSVDRQQIYSPSYTTHLYNPHLNLINQTEEMKSSLAWENVKGKGKGRLWKENKKWHKMFLIKGNHFKSFLKHEHTISPITYISKAFQKC